MRNFVFNEAMKLRRQTLIKLAKLHLNDNLKSELAKLIKQYFPALILHIELPFIMKEKF